MRALLSVSLAAITLVVCPSCSKSALTKADVRNFKLRDLVRYGGPQIRKVGPQDLKGANRADEQVAALQPQQQARLARQLANEVTGPINFEPPSLPGSSLAYAGGILPPKDGSSSSYLNIPGSTPVTGRGRALDTWSGFSIE